MANVSRANGFRPVRHLNGSPYTGQTNKYAAPASETTAIGIGDFVKLSTKPVLSGTYPGVESLGTGSVTSGPILGVVVGVEIGNVDGGVSGGASPTLDNPQYKPASTLKFLFVADASDLVYEGQEDSVGGDFALTSIGLNCAIQGAAASTTTGQSTQVLDSSVTPTTTSSYPLQIMGLVNRPDNTLSTNARWLVRINVHTFGSVGITAESRD